jgi:TonB family protein
MWLLVLYSFLAHVGLILGFAVFVRPVAKTTNMITVSIASPNPRAKTIQGKKQSGSSASKPGFDAGISPATPHDLATPLGDSLTADLSRPAQPAHIIKPRMPERAIVNEVEGEVVLELAIGADGSVKEALLVKKLGYGIDELALEAITQSTFKPAIDSQGSPIVSQAIYRYSFQFSDG